MKQLFTYCFLISTCLYISCTAPQPEEKKVEQKNTNPILIKEKTPIIREVFHVTPDKKILNLNNKQDFVSYQVNEQNIREQKVFSSDFLLPPKVNKHFDKEISMVIYNYYLNRKENLLYFIYTIPISKDSLYEGTRAVVNYNEYWLAIVQPKNMKILDYMNISSSYGLTYSSGSQPAFSAAPFLGFYADSTTFSYASYSHNNTLQQPFITINYKTNTTLHPDKQLFSKLDEIKEYKNLPIKYNIISFLSKNKIIITPELSKNYIIKDSIQFPKHKVMWFNDELTISTDSAKLYVNDKPIYNFADSLIPVYSNVNTKTKEINVISKSENYYYYQAVPY